MTVTKAKIKAVLFDIDDTLFDRKQAQFEIFKIIRSQFKTVFAGIDDDIVAVAFWEADRLATEAFFETGLAESIRLDRFKIFLKMLGLDDEPAGQMSVVYINSLAGIKAEVKDAGLILNHIAGKYQLGIISNGLADTQYRKLDAINARNLFECILISETAGIQKPDPGIYWQASALLGKQPSECLFIGNSYNINILGAKEAGMAACWFNPRDTRPIIESVKPDYEIIALNQLLDVLK